MASRICRRLAAFALLLMIDGGKDRVDEVRR